MLLLFVLTVLSERIILEKWVTRRVSNPDIYLQIEIQSTHSNNSGALINLQKQINKIRKLNLQFLQKHISFQSIQNKIRASTNLKIKTNKKELNKLIDQCQQLGLRKIIKITYEADQKSKKSMMVKMVKKALDSLQQLANQIFQQQDMKWTQIVVRQNKKLQYSQQFQLLVEAIFDNEQEQQYEQNPEDNQEQEEDEDIDYFQDQQQEAEDQDQQEQEQEDFQEEQEQQEQQQVKTKKKGKKKK